MTHVTTILGKEVGVQFQGTQDNTNFPSLNRQSNLLMLVEGVQRGRLDNVMQVTHGTLKSKLGFDRDGLEFQAVQDALLEGVPSVMVMRCFADKDEITANTPIQQPPINSQGGMQNSESSNGDTQQTGNQSSTAPDKVFFVKVNGNAVADFTIEQLKQQSFSSNGRIDIAWDEEEQKIRFSVSV